MLKAEHPVNFISQALTIRNFLRSFQTNVSKAGIYIIPDQRSEDTIASYGFRVVTEHRAEVIAAFQTELVTV